MIQCPSCGTHIADVARCCTYCGFEASDPVRPISQQCKFEAAPLIQVGMVQWKTEDSAPLQLSVGDNRRLVDLLSNKEWLQQFVPTIATFISQHMSQQGTGMIATFTKATQKLIDQGFLQLQLDKQGNFLPTVVDAKNRIREQARLEMVQFPPDTLPLLQHMQTQAAIAMVLSEIKDVERGLAQLKAELHQDRLAKADAAWQLLMQAARVTDSRRRDHMLDGILQMTAEAKQTLMRNYGEKWDSLRDSKTKDRSSEALGAFEDLVAITNMVQVETQAYAMAGEPEAQLYCLSEFRDFIEENKLDNRDTLLEINSRIKSASKQPQLVDHLERLAHRVIEMDEQAKLNGALNLNAIDMVGLEISSGK